MDEPTEDVPLPPADLPQRSLPLVTLEDLGTTLYRCHRLDRSYRPVAYNFSTVADRFNAPYGEYGVLYLATDPFAGFIETFGSGMVAADLHMRLVAESDLRRRCLCRIDCSADPSQARFVNLTDGFGCSRVGIDGRIGTTKRRDITREWALAFWSHAQQPHGILYRACNDPSRFCIVCFDRLGDVFAASCEVANILTDPHQLAAILDEYAIGLDPS
jgi:hypothetical protein